MYAIRSYYDNGTIINNCHRLNKKNFNRRAMSVTEITDSLLQPLLDIKAINKQLNILFTLSPVRHLRDCPQENSYVITSYSIHYTKLYD